MREQLQSIIRTYERTKAVAKATLLTAFYECDYELAQTCRKTIELTDKAIVESTSLLRLIEAREV